MLQSDPEAPAGYSMSLLGNINFDGALEAIQFVDEQNGFVLGTAGDDDHAVILKTVDGGTNWTSMEVLPAFTPISMLFLDAEIGFIPHYATDEYAHLLKTTDGGDSWDALSFPDLPGRFYDLCRDEAGNLFAILKDNFTTHRLVRSADQGETWEVIRELPEPSTDILRLYNNVLYVVTTDKKILQFDLDGNAVGETKIELTNNNTVELLVLDPDNMIAVSFYAVVKTKDGGAHWEKIYDQEAKLLNFSDPDHGIMIFNRGYCYDNPLVTSVISSTFDGGQSWQDSEDTEELITRSKGAFVLDNTRMFLLVDNLVYQISK